MKDLLLNVGSGGGAAAAPAAGGAAAGGGDDAAVEEKKEEKEEGESPHTPVTLARLKTIPNRKGRIRRGHGFRPIRLSHHTFQFLRVFCIYLGRRQSYFITTHWCDKEQRKDGWVINWFLLADKCKKLSLELLLKSLSCSQICPAFSPYWQVQAR